MTTTKNTVVETMQECAVCGECEIKENFTPVNYSFFGLDVRMICDECFNERVENKTYVQCVDTGEWYLWKLCEYVEHHGFVNLKTLYATPEYSQCPDCQGWFHIDDMRFSEDDYCDYCHYCYDERGYHDYIHAYHGGPSLDMRNSQNDELTIGFELELNGGFRNEFVDAIVDAGILDETRYKAEKDESLVNGVEIISAPFGVSNWDEVSKEIEIILDAAADNGMITTDNTGLHVHICRDYFNPMGNNMQYFLAMGLLEHVLVNWSDDAPATNYEDFTGRFLNTWCDTAYQSEKIEEKILRVLKAISFKTGWAQREELRLALLDFKEFYNGHKARGIHSEGINCFNNHNTCEFRFCASSTDAKEVKERIQFVIGLATWAREMSRFIIEQFDDFNTRFLPTVFNNKMLMTTGANMLNTGISGIHKVGKGVGVKGLKVELLQL